MNGRLVEKSLQLTKELVSFPSVSDQSNEAVSQHVANQLVSNGFDLEWHTYVDGKRPNQSQSCRQRGHGVDGVCYLAHTDVVPAEDWSVDFSRRV